MTTDNQAAPTGATLPLGLFGELEKNWGWLMAFGIFSILLGTVGLGMTFLLTEASLSFFAALLILGGVFQIMQAIKCHGWRGILLHVLIALFYVIAGLLIVLNPILTAITLTLTLGAVLIVVGIARIMLGIQMRPSPGWYWPLISGLISLLLGGLIIAQWPQSGFWVIGLFVAVELIFNGWSYLFIALAARAAGKAKSA
ncbi:HdeD family acid-resistance protein [Thiorhodovibrio frisius]|uniref:HdeD family acid-resistance protein n=1 Tax=Thiorhodovibrio frisius TaxID=631362 RepID=H8YZL4_9GAMM|nr:DUF308 domain-containing protein [Thiorhodovibrio frisius]EIC22141.1 hypothetical protein Thi970DRAFT_02391 [Thiorhodovibrio frisius]WPL24435.1 acid-resistance membrane protein [Thiorhodovibrio frisius]